MSQVEVDPDELEKFIRELNRFNQEMNSNLSRLKSQRNRLGDTWRDQQFHGFDQEFEQTTKILANFIKSSEGIIPNLQKRVRILKELQSLR
jgi:uncharacterized protein YukE